jgi:hypothetical protein
LSGPGDTEPGVPILGDGGRRGRGSALGPFSERRAEGGLTLVARDPTRYPRIFATLDKGVFEQSQILGAWN